MFYGLRSVVWLIVALFEVSRFTVIGVSSAFPLNETSVSLVSFCLQFSELKMSKITWKWFLIKTVCWLIRLHHLCDEGLLPIIEFELFWIGFVQRKKQKKYYFSLLGWLAAILSANSELSDTDRNKFWRLPPATFCGLRQLSPDSLREEGQLHMVDQNRIWWKTCA